MEDWKVDGAHRVNRNPPAVVLGPCTIVYAIEFVLTGCWNLIGALEFLIGHAIFTLVQCVVLPAPLVHRPYLCPWNCGLCLGIMPNNNDSSRLGNRTTVGKSVEFLLASTFTAPSFVYADKIGRGFGLIKNSRLKQPGWRNNLNGNNRRLQIATLIALRAPIGPYSSDLNPSVDHSLLKR